MPQIFLFHWQTPSGSLSRERYAPFAASLFEWDRDITKAASVRIYLVISYEDASGAFPQCKIVHGSRDDHTTEMDSKTVFLYLRCGPILRPQDDFAEVYRCCDSFFRTYHLQIMSLSFGKGIYRAAIRICCASSGSLLPKMFFTRGSLTRVFDFRLLSFLAPLDLRIRKRLWNSSWTKLGYYGRRSEKPCSRTT